MQEINKAQDNFVGNNNKKSGILVLCNNKRNDKDLGVLLDPNLSLVNHLYAINRKLSDYLKKNQWLLKDYFSSKSLLLIVNYYQMSRLSYFRCAYLDWGNLMESLEKARLKYFKSTLSIKDNVKSNLLRIVLNLPKMEYLLYDRLVKVVKKYTTQFGERPMIYHKILDALLNRLPYVSIMDDKQRLLYSKSTSMTIIARPKCITINNYFMSTFARHGQEIAPQMQVLSWREIKRTHCQ